MIKVSVKNVASQLITHQAKFPTQEEAQEWIAKQQAKANCQWGKLERVVPQDQCSPEEIEQALELIPVVSEGGAAFARLPQTYEVIIEDITVQVEAEAAKQAKIAAGKEARETCQAVLDLIAGYNLERELSLEQISQLQNMLSQPEATLRAGRPTLAKLLISVVVPDEDLVTSEMKSEALLLLAGY